MPSLGTQLKLAREKRGVTLEDISSSTKIGTRLLRAIETDQFDQLPGGIFNKGFVRAFARAVGVDEEKAVADYLAATEPAQPEAKNDSDLMQGIELHREAPSSGTSDLPWGWLALVLLLIALGFAAWGVWSRESRKAQTAPSSAAPASSNFQPAASSAPTPVSTETKMPPPAAELKPTSSPAGTADTMRPTAAAKTEMATAPGEISSSNSGYFSVHVKVRKDSWISLSSDGKVVLQGTILAPATKAVKAHNQIVVKAGNVGALDFEFNGESLPAQGQNGEVKTLTFGAEGLEAVQTVPAGPASGTPAATPTQP